MIGAAIEGFFHEAFHLAGLVVGYLLAAWQYQRLASWFAIYLKSPWVGEIAAFLIIFFAVLILAGFAGRIARWAMKKAGLSTIDAEKWLANSQLAPYFLVGGRAVIWLAPSELRLRFYQGLDYLRHAPSAVDSNRPTPNGPSK